jgi:hypothetical protein
MMEFFSGDLFIRLMFGHLKISFVSPCVSFILGRERSKAKQ